MADKRSQRKQKGRSLRVFGQAADALVKATAAEKKAQATVADANKKLGAAIRLLQHAKAGKSEERKAKRAVRSAVNRLVRAKRKLKKAEKKRGKATARQASKERTKAAARATGIPKSGPKPRGRAARPARASKPKPRRVTTQPLTPTPQQTETEDRSAETMEHSAPAQPVAELVTDA